MEIVSFKDKKQLTLVKKIFFLFNDIICKLLKQN